MEYPFVETHPDRRVKGRFQSPFVSRENILTQIGIVSFSERYWREYESGTPSPAFHSETIDEGPFSSSSKDDGILFRDSRMGGHRIFCQNKTSSQDRQGKGISEDEGNCRKVWDHCFGLPV